MNSHNLEAAQGEGLDDESLRGPGNAGYLRS